MPGAAEVRVAASHEGTGAAPGLVSSLSPGLAFLAGEHELAIIGSPGGHAPSPQIRGKRREQADRAVLARLRIGFLSERHRPLDEQGLLANVPPTSNRALRRTGFAEM